MTVVQRIILLLVLFWFAEKVKGRDYIDYNLFNIKVSSTVMSLSLLYQVINVFLSFLMNLQHTLTVLLMMAVKVKMKVKMKLKMMVKVMVKVMMKMTVMKSGN